MKNKATMTKEEALKKFAQLGAVWFGNRPNYRRP